MSTPVKDRMRTAAMADATLAALLGSTPFRWYDDQLVQGSNFPAVVAMQVSGNKTYTNAGRLPTGWSRFSFTIWGGYSSYGAEQREAVGAALTAFLDSWNGGTGIAGNAQYPNLCVLERDAIFASTQTPVYQKIMDFMIFSNDTL